LEAVLRLSTVLLLFLGGCCCGFAAGQDATAVITGPETASPGDLIILDASSSDCDSRKWLLVGSDKSFLQFEENRKCVFASGVSGRYHFVLATAKQSDSAVSLATSIHTITIGTPAPTPGPDPQPKPGPPPGPEPIPTPDLTGIAKQAYDVARQISRKPAEAAGIAAELESIAGKAAESGWTASQIADACVDVVINHTRQNTERWNPFRAFFLSVMKSATNHVDALEQIAEGLRAVDAASATTSDPANETIRSMLDKLRGDLRGIAQEVGQ
jgi:hypothetical protein